MNNQLPLFPDVPDAPPSFFNTSRSKGEQLKEYQNKATSQDDRILLLFRLMSAEWPEVWLLSASQVMNCYHHVRTCEADTPPITSIRRALTSLTEAGLLKKTDTQIAGPYGRPEYQYRLK